MTEAPEAPAAQAIAGKPVVMTVKCPGCGKPMTIVINVTILEGQTISVEHAH